ncbi:glycosyltransferase family 39 protein [Rufibacter psychrotolerans]|uniref:glycosyltransferase family 39 protein n=1 Tax=Rufibacter psychrotolerans TaxID=2812556 RepID=UPI001966EA9D|nr:glycosyltransferase family 39 protein [Rufibacter sp. SYSU D00308]
MTKLNGAKALLALAWLVLQVLLYQQHGVKVVYDSHRFILFTNEILAGQPVTYPQVWRYLGYPGFLLPFFYAGLSLKTIVWAQMAVSGLASMLLYRAARQLTKHEGLALLTAALFALNPDLQAWNCYILTDSLFTSLTTLCLCLLLLPMNRYHWGGFVLALLWAVLVRPNGFVVLLAVMGYYLLKYRPYRTCNKWVLATTGALLALLFYWVLDRFLLQAFTLMIPYERGDLIYGYYEIVLNKYYQPQMPPYTLTPLGQVVWFLWANPLYFVGMALLKGFFFFIHAKPYYSLAHNLLILAFLLPVYAFAWLGWRRAQLPTPVKALLLTPTLMQVGITMLTIEDWDGRWLYPVLPSILLLAALGARTTFPTLFHRAHLAS